MKYVLWLGSKNINEGISLYAKSLGIIYLLLTLAEKGSINNIQ